VGYEHPANVGEGGANLIDRPGSKGVLDVEGKFRVVCRVHDDPIHPKSTVFSFNRGEPHYDG